ncbi:hypothetical protein KUTeg_008165 [Tegillarca granosa]|uniref:Uncharacterized protein n=1 Tax=Tegillarca granosa TaxID=220873 RepID=A0ABQ9F8E3_TEGGR|nr:hypothetical protein KUTeg_008165 [Tegillarca granosa]
MVMVIPSRNVWKLPLILHSRWGKAHENPLGEMVKGIQKFCQSQNDQRRCCEIVLSELRRLYEETWLRRQTTLDI